MLRSIVFTAAGVAFSVATVGTASAGGHANRTPQACAKRTDAVTHLASKYEEAPVAIGIANNGGVLEVLSSDKGSWTILVTMPNGVSCMLATGQSWEALEPVVAGSSS